MIDVFHKYGQQSALNDLGITALEKRGQSPVWVRVPWSPFTFLGSAPRHERLPGMTEWAPREVVERVGKGLQQKVDPDILTAREEHRGLLKSMTAGGIGGFTGGALAGRLAKGEAASAPLKAILAKGINRQTLAGLKKIPRLSKMLPLIGAGAGLLGRGGRAVDRDTTVRRLRPGARRGADRVSEPRDGGGSPR